MAQLKAEPGAVLDPIERGPIQRPQIARFAAATGDFNPIHCDEAFAQKVGFPSVIAHGPLPLAFLVQALGHNFGAENVRAVSAQFRAPVLPGDTLRVEGTVTEVMDLPTGRRVVCDLRVVRVARPASSEGVPDTGSPVPPEVVVVGSGQAEIS